METESRLLAAAKEALLVLLSAVLLGFAYTVVTKKGFFSPSPVATSQPTSIVAPEFISFEEAVSFFSQGTALFVDARHEFDYKLGHIKGAINVPLKDFRLENSPLAAVSRDKRIVTYCDGAECNSSIELAKKLSEAGFTNVKMFFGGWNEWQNNHLETEH